MKYSVKKLNILTMFIAIIFVMNIVATVLGPSVASADSGMIFEEEIFGSEEEIGGEIDTPVVDEGVKDESFTQESLIKKVFDTINGDMSYKSSATGTVKTNVKIVGNITQNIQSSTQRDSNGKVLLFSASVKTASIGVTVGRQVYTKDGLVYYRDAKEVSSSFVPTYGDGWNKSSIDDYHRNFGMTAGKCYYNVDESTILSYNEFKATTTGYKCVIELNVSKAVADYTRNVASMSGSSTTPIFEYVKLTITTDKEGLPKRIVAQEKYTVTVMGFTASCTTMTATKYTNWGKYFSLSDPKGIN